MTKEIQEKKWLEFQTWIKADSFEVFKEYLLKKQKAYQEDIAKMLRSDNCDLAKVRVAQALSDNITLVLTTHIDGILKELKPLDQADDVQIY
jgi:hypothetical protein